jgi:hypothetical protein
MSAPEPGPSESTILTGLVGHCWANEASGKTASKAANKKRVIGQSS